MDSVFTHRERELTHDERKAAEAAFNGLPFDERWSPSARTVYNGILGVKGIETAPLDPRLDQLDDAKSGAIPPAVPDSTDPQAPVVMTREEAIESGYLIDVTPIANNVGLPFPVFLSRPVWELLITASRTLTDDGDHEPRVRDVLMALRLQLAFRMATPGVDFPALLSFPPDPVPQLCMLRAMAQGDNFVPFSLILMLPGEIIAPTLPPNN